jgi:hypothetical protein
VLTHRNERFGGLAAVLAQRQHELSRHEAAPDRSGGRRRLVGRHQDAAGQVLLEDVINHGAALVSERNGERYGAEA